MFASGLTFVGSYLNITGDLPLELVPGYTLRAATNEEITRIKQLIASSAGNSLWINYEATVSVTPTENGSKADFIALPQESWMYWVVAYEGNGNDIHEIAKLTILLKVEIAFAFSFHFDGASQTGEVHGWMLPGQHVIDKFCNMETVWNPPSTIDTTAIQEVSLLWGLYSALSIDHVQVKRAVDMFSDLQRVPSFTALYVVGLFSIIEALVTHAPRPMESLESITHQLIHKINLLQKMYSTPVIPEQYFSQGSDKTIWKALYKYRSNAAHGGSTAFTGDLSVLVEQKKVVNFLRDNVKELLKLALSKPTFIEDLSNC